MEKFTCSFFIIWTPCSGEISAFILKNSDKTQVFINEKSPHLKHHLHKYLESISKKRSIFLLKDYKKIKIPKTDLIISGIFYGEIPYLIKEKGEELKKSLSKKGLLVIQSGMPENLFALSVIDNSIFPSIKKWAWYNEKYDLRRLFKNVKTIFLDGEIITIASQSKESIRKVIENLKEAKEFKLPK